MSKNIVLSMTFSNETNLNFLSACLKLIHKKKYFISFIQVQQVFTIGVEVKDKLKKQISKTSFECPVAYWYISLSNYCYSTKLIDTWRSSFAFNGPRDTLEDIVECTNRILDANNIFSTT